MNLLNSKLTLITHFALAMSVVRLIHTTAEVDHDLARRIGRIR
jgi:hypothetical protein